MVSLLTAPAFREALPYRPSRTPAAVHSIASTLLKKPLVDSSTKHQQSARHPSQDPTSTTMAPARSKTPTSIRASDSHDRVVEQQHVQLQTSAAVVPASRDSPTSLNGSDSHSRVAEQQSARPQTPACQGGCRSVVARKSRSASSHRSAPYPPPSAGGYGFANWPRFNLQTGTYDHSDKLWPVDPPAQDQVYMEEDPYKFNGKHVRHLKHRSDVVRAFKRTPAELWARQARNGVWMRSMESPTVNPMDLLINKPTPTAMPPPPIFRPDMQPSASRLPISRVVFRRPGLTPLPGSGLKQIEVYSQQPQPASLLTKLTADHTSSTLPVVGVNKAQVPIDTPHLHQAPLAAYSPPSSASSTPSVGQARNAQIMAPSPGFRAPPAMMSAQASNPSAMQPAAMYGHAPPAPMLAAPGPLYGMLVPHLQNESVPTGYRVDVPSRDHGGNH